MNDKSIVIKLLDNYKTNFSGIKRLFDFYKEASQYKDQTIYLDFYKLIWFDANLSALFGSILAKLTNENNLEFSTDLKFLEENFDVLFRNGFLSSKNQINDKQESTIAFRAFEIDDKEGFVNYIENILINHRGMPKLLEKDKDIIIDSLIEVFCNIQAHAKTNEPFYVCGQYFPKQKQLAFSMVDLGIGFLPAIQEKTRGEINNSYEAINWALEKRHTTKDNKLGGFGLYDLNTYFSYGNGGFQIISGDTYWSLDMQNSLMKSFKFPNPYVGSILNLFFNHE